ncbi:MAG: hypothetical protein WC915_06235 [archaeon]
MAKVNGINFKRREQERANQVRKSPIKMLRRIKAKNYLDLKKGVIEFKKLGEIAKTVPLENKKKFMLILGHLTDKIEDSLILDKHKKILLDECSKIAKEVRNSL